jgi:transposase
LIPNRPSSEQTDHDAERAEYLDRLRESRVTPDASRMKEHKVEGLLNLGFDVTFHRRRVRHYGDRPTRIVVEEDPGLVVQVNEVAVREALRRKGWRVYVTNAPKSELPLSQAVLAYRNQYIVERGCGRLKGRPLSLRPMYLERDDHATGLIRLLTICLRVLTLLEFVVRQRLAQEGTELAGVYAGNPKRSTARPSAELLLEAFEDRIRSTSGPTLSRRSWHTACWRACGRSRPTPIGRSITTTC